MESEMIVPNPGVDSMKRGLCNSEEVVRALGKWTEPTVRGSEPPGINHVAKLIGPPVVTFTQIATSTPSIFKCTSGVGVSYASLELRTGCVRPVDGITARHRDHRLPGGTIIWSVRWRRLLSPLGPARHTPMQRSEQRLKRGAKSVSGIANPVPTSTVD
jgi:hypothetical protein